MAENTGYKGWTGLKKVVDGGPNDGQALDDGNRLVSVSGQPQSKKPNNISDDDYIAPVVNLTDCPIPVVLKTGHFDPADPYFSILTMKIDGGAEVALTADFDYYDSFEILLPVNTGLNISYYDAGISNGDDTEYYGYGRSILVEFGSPFYNNPDVLNIVSYATSGRNLNIKLQSFTNDATNPLATTGVVRIDNHTAEKLFSEAGDGINANDPLSLVHHDGTSSIIVRSPTRPFVYDITINGTLYTNIIANANTYGNYSGGVIFPYIENTIVNSLVIKPL